MNIFEILIRIQYITNILEKNDVKKKLIYELAKREF